MKLLSEKQISKKGRKMVWQKARLILLLFGVFIFAQTNVSAQSSPCDESPVQTVSRTEAILIPFTIPNGDTGDAYFDVLRNGEISHSIVLWTTVPTDTVFNAYLNGTYLATLQRYSFGEFDVWYWYSQGNTSMIARIGDVISLTKNGETYLSATYGRRQYEYEQVTGFYENGILGPCSKIRANVYVPTSKYPSVFQIDGTIRAYASEPITKISLNEPSLQPGIPGQEIFNYQITQQEPTPPWYYAVVHSTYLQRVELTEHQFSLLRQGLLSIVIYTAIHPNGYSQMPLTTQGINSSGDFEGDGLADLAVFRPSEKNWYVNFSSNNQVQITNFGNDTDNLVIGDYDSDAKADITTFQTDNANYPGLGVWQILKSSDNSLQTIQWGLPGDVPLAVNIDTNNTSDLGIFRPSTGTWYIKRMGDIIKPLTNNFGGQNYVITRWGTTGDKPLAGDFDNDRIDELIVFRPSEGNWYIHNTASNSYQILHWGLSGDIPIAKDFDGDGKVDITVYRPSEGVWYIRSSLDNSMIVRRFGLSEDIPVPADFDKDGVADIAVFRPSNGTWYVLRSSDNSFFAAQFGLEGDIPALAQR